MGIADVVALPDSRTSTGMGMGPWQDGAVDVIRLTTGIDEHLK